jgi:hypothetical protein
VMCPRPRIVEDYNRSLHVDSVQKQVDPAEY